MENVRNKQFEILLVLAISFVVMGHAWVDIGTLQYVFPYDSFHMPLFMFISGYFFNKKYIENGTLNFVKKQILTLLIPFFVLNLLYGIIAVFLWKIYYVNWVSGHDFINKVFIRPFTYGNTFFGLNDATWYILMFFEVKIADHLLKKFLYKYKIQDIAVLIIYLVVSAFAVTYSRSTDKLPVEFSIIRILYMLFWYQTGYIYKQYVEKHDTLNNFTFFSVVIFFQFCIKIYSGDERMTAGIWNATFDQNAFITILAATNGIAFFLRLSRILVPLHNTCITYISKHTFSIMANHMLGFFLLNIILLKTCHYWGIGNFDMVSFKNSLWYRYLPCDLNSFRVVFVLWGMIFSLLLALLYEKIKNYLTSLCRSRKIETESE
ncbi:acyltransferase family protein [Desulfovibrio desulfuricans]|uniref:acyltransferase family protein n=1 Tax=Desulfovibrio desulfuricans TaxID=876 RepID=UPI001D06F030|nr:acyltransferase family protein [Desulfovibrio desulfuricans]MCB6543568.1 acyltransferase family protein [Desulfovibrio desulfuricans]MCB6554653.1 acyltransferase family protein [Desulfovibrio desulfuricans]MCB6566505.1 acyltransferase family protein [Desulfovibrio desulfuricans]MCB7347686.1 acyltransferase family protein [Desulfovibrio desulfuricans]MCQ5217599.1 acyltransferase family protein [Desulfovibrio desulfuricans]